MAVAYIDLDTALSRVIERSAGYATSDDCVLLRELLQLLSASGSSGVIHYRPYLAAAYFLEQNPKVQLLKQEGDTHYTLLSSVITSLRSLQAAYDIVQGLTVNSGLEAVSHQVRLSSPLSSITIQTQALI